MSDLVSPGEIEGIVGAQRHPVLHYARAVSAEQTFYILHSAECLDSGIDLRDCRFSLALDRGIDLDVWGEWQDRPVVAQVLAGRLVPHRDLTLSEALMSEDDGLHDCGLCTEVFYSETEPAELTVNGYPAVVCKACDRLEPEEVGRAESD